MYELKINNQKHNVNVEADNYTIDVKAHGDDNTVASFDAPFNSYGGRSGVVVASGFLSPAEQDSAFALIFATPDGETLLSPVGNRVTQFNLYTNI